MGLEVEVAQEGRALAHAHGEHAVAGGGLGGRHWRARRRAGVERGVDRHCMRQAGSPSGRGEVEGRESAGARMQRAFNKGCGGSATRPSPISLLLPHTHTRVHTRTLAASMAAAAAAVARVPHRTSPCRALPSPLHPPVAAGTASSGMRFSSWAWRRADSAARRAGAAAAAAGTAAPAPRTAPAREEWVEVGLITQPHGVRGEMKVQPLTDFPQERLATPGTRCAPAGGGAGLGRVRAAAELACACSIQPPTHPPITHPPPAAGCRHPSPSWVAGASPSLPRWSWSGGAAR